MSVRRFSAFAAAGLFTLAVVAHALAQEPPSSAARQAPAAQPSPAPSATTPAKGKKHSHADDFLIRGTVFTPEGLSFHGAELKIRRAAEKRFRWETYTNSRGEFAVRVPPGADYEIIVRAKGFTEQSRPVDGKNSREETLVFRLEALTGKTGGKS